MNRSVSLSFAGIGASGALFDGLPGIPCRPAGDRVLAREPPGRRARSGGRATDGTDDQAGRVLAAFEHRETDRVPLYDLMLNDDCIE